MPSPFPGMNPYLEQPDVWRGFHTNFLVYLSAAISPLVVPRYLVETEESLFIDPADDGREFFGVSDTLVADLDPDARTPGGASRAAVADAPVTVTIPRVTQRKVRRLVVRDFRNREVVTTVEILSPANKHTGPHRDLYLQKRTEVLTSRTSFVEIDLLRGGRRLPIRDLPDCEYYALVSRWWERPAVGLWPVRLRDPLPTIPIPLRRHDPAPRIDLKAVLDRTYDEHGYAYRIYHNAPEPRLSPDDAAWAKSLIPAAP